MFDPLTIELEVALLHELHQAWTDLNWASFKSAMRPPILRLSNGEGRLGQWLAVERTIALSRRFVTESPWGAVLEVLRHEAAHQYVDEVLRVADESAHGPAFRKVCERLGIDAAAAGVPAVSPEPADERILSRVQKLLALAQSSNEHEAQAAMNAAQRLMLRHNLEAGAARRYLFRHLGVPTGRVTEAERILAQILGDHFFVETIWIPVWRAREGKRGTVLEIIGTPSNLEIATYVHEFLLRTAARLWDEYQRAQGVPGRERRAYLAGVMTGFRDKLEAQAQRHKQEEALVWTGDPGLNGYFRRRHPRVRMTHYTASGPSEARADGRTAGQGIVLHRGVTQRGSSQRLLTS